MGEQLPCRDLAEDEPLLPERRVYPGLAAARDPADLQVSWGAGEW